MHHFSLTPQYQIAEIYEREPIMFVEGMSPRPDMKAVFLWHFQKIKYLLGRLICKLGSKAVGPEVVCAL